MLKMPLLKILQLCLILGISTQLFKAVSRKVSFRNYSPFYQTILNGCAEVYTPTMAERPMHERRWDVNADGSL